MRTSVSVLSERRERERELTKRESESVLDTCRRLVEYHEATAANQRDANAQTALLTACEGAVTVEIRWGYHRLSAITML